MAQQTIGIGAVANDGTGDTIRDSFDKCNDNFTELYTGLTGLLDFKGSTNCSGNPNYPAASKGDFYLVSAAGKIGGASGIVVEVGDSYFATADNAGGTQAGVGTSWTVIQGNITSYLPLSGGTLTGDLVVPAEVYGGGWDGSNEVPTKNDVYDKIEAVIAGAGTISALDDVPDVNAPSPSDGDVLTFDSGSGDWVNAAPTGGGGGGGTPTVVASNTQSSSTNSYTVTWPTGTAAGDWVFIFMMHGFIINAVSGWQCFDNQNGSNVSGACYAKKMTSGDISTGNVTITTTSSFNGVIQSITIRNLTGVRDYRFIRDSAGWSTYPVGLPMADSTDLILIFAATRATSSNTFSPSLTVQQTQNATSASAALGSSSSLALAELGASTTISFPGSTANGAYVAALALC